MKVKQRMCSLNEALINEAKDLDPVDVIPAASPAHVHAEAERKALRAQAEEVTEEQRRAADNFDKENQPDKKIPKNPAFKKLHLEESLLEDAPESNVSKARRYLDVEIPDICKDALEGLDGANPKVVEEAVEACRKLYNVLEGLLQEGAEDNDVSEDVDPDFFEDDEEPVQKEAVEAPEKPKKGFGFGEREKKERRDYSSEDLWLAVYDELSATTDNEGDGQQVNKQIKAKRGERYEKVFPHGDTDIIIYAPSIEKFEFAKKVADHYGVTYDEPREDKNKSTNGFYRYSMVIHIPEDELYSED